MLDFMHAGGMMMWPLLALGVTAIVTAVKQRLHGGEGAIDPQRLVRGVLAGSLAWCCAGLIMVCRAAQELSTQAAAGEEGPPNRFYIEGIGEALSPAVLGLACFAVVALIGSISRPGARAHISGPGQA